MASLSVHVDISRTPSQGPGTLLRESTAVCPFGRLLGKDADIAARVTNGGANIDRFVAGRRTEDLET